MNELALAIGDDAALLTHEQRVELLRRWEESSHPNAKLLLEAIDNLLDDSLISTVSDERTRISHRGS